LHNAVHQFVSAENRCKAFELMHYFLQQLKVMSVNGLLNLEDVVLQCSFQRRQQAGGTLKVT
jgi:hypothetical protein